MHQDQATIEQMNIISPLRKHTLAQYYIEYPVGTKIQFAQNCTIQGILVKCHARGLIFDSSTSSQKMEYKYSIIATPGQHMLHQVSHHQISELNAMSHNYAHLVQETANNLDDVDSHSMQSDIDPSLMEKSRTVWHSITSTINKNEFEYSLHSAPQWITTLYFLKHVEDWDFNLKSRNDLKVFYDSIQLRLHNYNIINTPFNNLTIEDSISVITQHNWPNCVRARESVSWALFT